MLRPIDLCTRQQLIHRTMEEHQYVAAIREFLLTPEQNEWLMEQNLEISLLLNGYVGNHLTKIAEMFQDWNNRLGHPVFSLTPQPSLYNPDNMEPEVKDRLMLVTFTCSLPVTLPSVAEGASLQELVEAAQQRLKNYDPVVMRDWLPMLRVTSVEPINNP